MKEATNPWEPRKKLNAYYLVKETNLKIQQSLCLPHKSL